MSDSRARRIRGRSPPGRPDWEVSTIYRRVTDTTGTATCAVTGDDVPLHEPHYRVTIRNAGEEGETYDHLVVAFDALDELEGWLEPTD